MSEPVQCFHCGKAIGDGPQSRVEWKGYGTTLNFHPNCLIGQVEKMRRALNELHKAGWL